jgi:hypothetical protein
MDDHPPRPVPKKHGDWERVKRTRLSPHENEPTFLTSLQADGSRLSGPSRVSA